MDIETITKAYIKIRDQRTKLKKEFDAEYEKLGSYMSLLEAQMLRFLMENKAQSASTESGTIYRQEKLTPSCADWNVLDNWALEHHIAASDIMEKRLSQKFIQNYIDSHDGNTPPGVNVFREYVVRVRRS